MPVHRNNFGGCALRQPMRRPESDIKERENSPEKMEAVRSGENVEKAAGRIRREKNAGSSKLAPGDYLADQKENSENGGNAPPAAKASVVVFEKACSGASERETAGDENRGVQPKDPRDIERDPCAVGHVLADDVGADKRHEKHQYAAESNRHPGDVGALRYASGAERIFPIVAAPAGISVVAGRRSAATFTGADQLDFVCDCAAWHHYSCADSPLFQACCFLRRQILRDEILSISRDAEFIWTAIHAGIMAAEIIDGRRRVRDPFESRSIPRILAGDRAVLQAPEKVEEENELRSRCDKRGVGHEHMYGLEHSRIGSAGCIRVAAYAACKSDEMHGHENTVGASKRDPEVELA